MTEEARSGPEALAAFQATNRQNTVAKLDAAMATIVSEIAESGYYPHNKGRVDRAELCRRAGVGASTLKNKTHTETAEKVRLWLRRLKKTAPVAKPDADEKKRQRILDLTGQVEQIARNYNRFKIEYDRLLAENARLETENATLRRRLIELGGEGSNVVRIKDKPRPA